MKKGWGFIIGENGEDIFVHQSGVNKAGFRSLDDGEMVEYEIRNTDKGPEACKITGPQGKALRFLHFHAIGCIGKFLIREHLSYC